MHRNLFLLLSLFMGSLAVGQTPPPASTQATPIPVIQPPVAQPANVQPPVTQPPIAPQPPPPSV
ncbi:MAG: hypothetical protein WCH43_12925, partial [Verrucomicrobiota bacterium]